MYNTNNTDGNFYSLGKAQRNFLRTFDEKSFEGMGKIAEAIALEFLNDKHKDKLQGRDLEIHYHLPHIWPADKLLLGLGFCRFFRGFYDYEECYNDLSVYNNANLKQLYVMNYLFALNHYYSTDMENKRKDLSNKLAYAVQKEVEKVHTLVKK